MKVRQMNSTKSNRPVANQFVIYLEDRVVFQSYDSIIAVRHDNGAIELGEDWNYSRTTAKYRNEFLNENTAETRKKLKSGIYTLNKSL